MITDFPWLIEDIPMSSARYNGPDFHKAQARAWAETAARARETGNARTRERAIHTARKHHRAYIRVRDEWKQRGLWP